jgi:hypothetical protein
MTTPEHDYDPTTDVGTHPSTDAETPQATDVEARDTTDVDADRLTDTEAAPTLVDGSGELFERWQRAQAAFVDAPREAVHEAGTIVEDVLGRLSKSFDTERSRLEQAWQAGEEPSTEDLRIAIQRYRTFFERLLAA